VFEQRKPGQKYCRPEHRLNPPRPGRVQASVAARGYGYEHQKKRRAALATLKPGTPCPRCGQEMYPDQKLHFDHADDDRNYYLGLSHASCNLRAGAIRGNRLRKRPWWQRQRVQLTLFSASAVRPVRPVKMRECACGKEFPAHKAGRGSRCPACWAHIAEQVRAMRATGALWREIADALGLCNAARAYSLSFYRDWTVS
jgi:hypothetical protein